jgi:cellulose synthase (UDP-forming)
MTSRGQHAVVRAVANERIFRWWDYPIFALLTIVNLTAVFVLARYWVSHGDLHRQTLAYLILTIPLVVALTNYETRWLLLPLMCRPRPMEPTAGWRVGVATTFVPGAEPIEMLAATVAALVDMEYPHETWVLDEVDDPAVKRLCTRLGARHFSRRERAEYQTESGRFERRTKHGNYNAWLNELGFDRFDIIVGFDPDHVPARDFLLRTLGYLADPSIGYVQAAQVYYNQPASFVARGAAEETYAYYSSIQMTTYALGYPIVTGCHNVHRANALRQVGGFAPHEADDLLITTLYRAAGWRGVYVPETLALGLTPVDWAGYLKQQRRWARSVLDVKFRIYPKLAGRLPRVERVISLAHGLYYFHGLATLVNLGLLVFMLASGLTPTVVSFRTVPYALTAVIALQACEFYRQRFFLNRRTECGLHVRAGLLRFAKWPAVLVALFDALQPRRTPYMITPKVRYPLEWRALLVPHAIASIAILAAIVVGALTHGKSNSVLLIAAGAIVASSGGIMLTAFRGWPPPFDSDLLVRALSGRCRWLLGRRQAT